MLLLASYLAFSRLGTTEKLTSAINHCQCCSRINHSTLLIVNSNIATWPIPQASILPASTDFLLIEVIHQSSFTFHCKQFLKNYTFILFPLFVGISTVFEAPIFPPTCTKKEWVWNGRCWNFPSVSRFLTKMAFSASEKMFWTTLIKKTTPFTPFPARRLLLIETFTLFPRHINDPLSIQRVPPFYYFGLSILRGERGFQHLTVARNAASTGSASSKIGAGHSKLDQFGELLAEMVGLEDWFFQSLRPPPFNTPCPSHKEILILKVRLSLFAPIPPSTWEPPLYLAIKSKRNSGVDLFVNLMYVIISPTNTLLLRTSLIKIFVIYEITLHLKL